MQYVGDREITDVMVLGYLCSHVVGYVPQIGPKHDIDRYYGFYSMLFGALDFCENIVPLLQPCLGCTRMSMTSNVSGLGFSSVWSVLTRFLTVSVYERGPVGRCYVPAAYLLM